MSLFGFAELLQLSDALLHAARLLLALYSIISQNTDQTRTDEYLSNAFENLICLKKIINNRKLIITKRMELGNRGAWPWKNSGQLMRSESETN